MTEGNSVRYPIEPNEQLVKDEHGKSVNPTQFKSMIGRLRYHVLTRSDIPYLVGVVSRFMERPTLMHLNVIKRIMRYIK